MLNSRDVDIIQKPESKAVMYRAHYIARVPSIPACYLYSALHVHKASASIIMTYNTAACMKTERFLTVYIILNMLATAQNYNFLTRLPSTVECIVDYIRSPFSINEVPG